ncbi:MAG: 2OG-Fe(II) oxygenase [Gammaproteobacteria bacterium]|nr:2OG-Fe(II) oxygenase [Gammaproteobacteria bacterium]
MEARDRQDMFAATDAGNKAAERLLLADLLASNSREEIELLLAKKQQREGECNARYLRAELACFHAYPAESGWEELLMECCNVGHKEALFVAAIYHDWAGHAQAAEALVQRINDPSTNVAESDVVWRDGWSAWSLPEWQVVADTNGVRISRSSRFASNWLIGFLRTMLGPQLRPAEVIDPESGQTTAHPVRINRVAQWLPEQLGWIGKLFECRLAAAAGYDVSNGEVLSLLHYQPGQRYKPHLDCLGIKQSQSDAGKEEGGQRTTTLLFAMGNDDYTGGETHFPKLDVSVKGATGELVRFNNTDDELQPLRESLHEGVPVESGEKWLLSKWVRERSTPYGREINLRCND